MMTRVLKTIMVTVCLLAAVAALAAPTAAYRLHVDGLSCPFCAYGIEKRLGQVKGVRQVEVDIASGSVTVTMAEGATLNESDARQAVLDAGFKLRSLDAVRPAAIDTAGAAHK